MAGKRDHAVVVVITDVTQKQAADIMSDAIKSKNKRAPQGRGIATAGKKTDVGKMLGDGHNNALKQIQHVRGGSYGKPKQLPYKSAEGG